MMNKNLASWFKMGTIGMFSLCMFLDKVDLAIVAILLAIFFRLEEK